MLTDMASSRAFPPYPWQASVWQHLMKLLHNDRLPHAILLQGAAGWGKRDLARSFAQQLFCKTPMDSQPCGQCKDCLLFLSEDGHPDFLQLVPDGKMQMIKVEAVREVVAFMSQTAQQGGYRVIIVDQAHCMNIAASNCLLKTLEEPGAKTLLLLISDAAELLLPTIQSRCQKVFCHANLNAEIENYLAPYLSQTHLPLSCLWQLSRGSPLAIRLWLETGYLNHGENLVNQLLQGFSALSLAAELNKQALADNLFWLQQLLSDCIKVKSGITDQLIFSHLQQALIQFCQTTTLDNLFTYLQKCYHYSQILNQKVSINETLALEDLLIAWQKLLTSKG